MSELSITTTQNVNINFTAASVADRMLAYLVDLLIKSAYFVVVWGIVFYSLVFNQRMAGLDTWSYYAVVVIFYSPVLFYSLLFESLLEGQTLGKRLLKTIVV